MAKNAVAVTVKNMVGSEVPAGWYPDPSGQPGAERYFDGTRWTEQTRTVQVQFPVTLPPSASTLAARGGVHTARLLDQGASSSFPTGEPAPAPATTSGQFANPARMGPLPQHGPAPARGTWTSSVDPNSSQALLTDVVVKAPKRRPARADAGWYPDPARTSNLRFYDGRGWTGRTRRPADEGRRKLPAAALALQARVLEVADAQASRSDAGEKFRRRVVSIHRPQGLPRDVRAVRTRAGRVGGMLSMVAVVAGLGYASLLGWQYGLSGPYQAHEQASMRHTLSKEMTFDTYGSNPAPVKVTTVGTTTTKPAGKHSYSARADISPLPPAGWTPPANRHAGSVKSYKIGQPIGRIVIPRMGVDEVMVAGTGIGELAKGVGVATWGAMPGSPGNATLAGHRTGNGHLFYKMNELRYGDQIIIEIPGEGRAVYEVRGYEILNPDDTWVTKQTSGVRLTLTTCHPPGSTGKRYVVQAEMISGDWVDEALNRSQWHMVRR